MIVVGFDPVWSVFSVPLTDNSLLAAVHGDGQLDTGLLAECEALGEGTAPCHAHAGLAQRSSDFRRDRLADCQGGLLSF